jgi:hypothetical protein
VLVLIFVSRLIAGFLIVVYVSFWFVQLIFGNGC